MQNQTIGITVNGQPLTVPAKTTISELLVQLNIRSRAIAVELNLEIQPAHCFDQQVLNPGDSLEIVTLAGGG